MPMSDDTGMPRLGETAEMSKVEGDGLPAREEYLRLIEAILFAAAEPVGEAAIARRLPEDVDVLGLLNEIKERYAARGIHVVRIADKWTMRTAPDLGPRMQIETRVPRKLTRAQTETLAIIAYHQPITRPEIEEVRGVALSPSTLEILLEAGWIKPGRRRQTPGRPTTWMTTDAFLDQFGLERLDDLPGIAELRATGLLDARPTNLPFEGGKRGDGDAEEPENDDDAADAAEALGTDAVTDMVEGAVERK
jgi:segregation and condensation protein B